MDKVQRDKNLVPTSQNDNLSFIYIYKKAEKLTAALHVVTSNLNNEEPICRLLREKGLEVFSGIVALGTSGKKSGSKISDLRALIAELISLLSVANKSSYISEANYALLEGEYIDLSTFIEKNKARLLEENILSKEALSVPYSRTAKQPVSYKRQNISVPEKGQIREQEKIVDPLHGDRRKSILSVVSEKGNVSVKDISQVITNCSEKTIQRELAALVKQGTLKKEGERRWSTYSLA